MTWDDVRREDTFIRDRFAHWFFTHRYNMDAAIDRVSDECGRTPGAVFATLQEKPMERKKFRMRKCANPYEPAGDCEE